MRRWAKSGDTPGRRTRTGRSRGPDSRALSGILASGSTPLDRDRCAGRSAGWFARLGACSTAREVTRYGSKVFISEQDPSIRLTVIMANRLPFEQQTGADLIYFNETYRNFVMVQYKAMEKRERKTEFRWQAQEQFSDEVGRMETLLEKLRKVPGGQDPDGYRFAYNPFFLKFCPRVLFNPDDRGLFKGIYVPLDLWKRANAASRFKGKRGGNVLTYENAGRRINNSAFVTLVAGSWVGT